LRRVVGLAHVGKAALEKGYGIRKPLPPEKFVLTGGEFGADREPVRERRVKSDLELPWPTI
jgi:hypothetical protein